MYISTFDPEQRLMYNVLHEHLWDIIWDRSVHGIIYHETMTVTHHYLLSYYLIVTFINWLILLFFQCQRSSSERPCTWPMRTRVRSRPLFTVAGIWATDLRCVATPGRGRLRSWWTSTRGPTQMPPPSSSYQVTHRTGQTLSFHSSSYYTCVHYISHEYLPYPAKSVGGPRYSKVNGRKSVD